MLQTIDRLYARLLEGLAALAGVLILISIVLVVLNVVGRASGIGAFRFTIAVVEYILLYFTLLAAPYLLRIKGHVLVDVTMSRLSGTPRIILESMVYLVGIAVSLIFAVVSVFIIMEAVQRGAFDERSIDIPYWVLYVLFPLSFGLLAIEFTRYLVSANSLYEERETQEGLS